MSHAPARNTDPITSHLAADHVVGSGLRAAQQRLAIEAVRQYPGLTSLELAKRSTLCRFMLARRLPECARLSSVKRGQSRRCSRSGRQAVTWWPPGMEEQLNLLNDGKAAA